MYFSSDSDDSEDDTELVNYKLLTSKRIHRDSLGDTVVYDPRRYHAPMHISDLLKRFKASDNGNDVLNGRASGLSVPSSSSTRRSYVISSPVNSRSGTGRGTRLRFPIEVDVKGQEQWDDLMAKEGLIVVDAYAKWCGPCKAIESTFRRIRNESGDDLLHFAIAETDNIESLTMYREKSRPTFLFYGGGQLVHVIRGCNAPHLIKSIHEFLKEEHKIMNGEAERKTFVDVEVQLQEEVTEEKGDDEKSADEEEEDEMGGLFARFFQSGRMTDVVEVPKEISVAIIKPDALKNGYADEIIRSIEESGIEILHKEEKILSKEEAAEFYKQHEGSDHFEQLIDFMSSGPVLTLVLSKKGDDAGYGLIPEIRGMIGPTDVNLAKEEAPDSIRAQYGTDEIMNAVHACDSSESAARELAFFFPDFHVPKVQEKRKRKRIQRTLALIRPDAYMRRKESVISKIQESGFQIAMSKEMNLTREQAEEFYADHKDEDYFQSLISNMTSGPSLALCLAREDAVEAWRNLLGPKDVAEAKETAPDSLRAVFAEDDTTVNQIHGAATPSDAEKELHKFFPLQSTVAVIKPEAYSIPEQREQIVETIQQSGFRISAQKEINLTKELASQFYKEHEGKEFFGGLTDYMSSGPTLFLILSKEDAIPGFRALVGPSDPDKAKEEAPNSLRALYATDSMKNAIHSSSDVEKATETIHEFFPEVEINPDGTVKEPPKKHKSKKHVENEQERPVDSEGEPAAEGQNQGAGGEEGEGGHQEGDQKDTGDQNVDSDQQAEAQKVEGDQQGDNDKTEGAQEAVGGQEAAGEQPVADEHKEGATESVEEGSKEQQTPSGDQPAQAGGGANDGNEAEVNNNEDINAKPDVSQQGADEGGKGNQEEENQEEVKTDADEANTNDDASKTESVANEETQNETQASTATDNNGEDNNNNGEDSNNETAPQQSEPENKDSAESATNNEDTAADSSRNNEVENPAPENENNDAGDGNGEPEKATPQEKEDVANEATTESKETEGERQNDLI